VRKFSIILITSFIIAILVPALMAEENEELWSRSTYIQSAKVHYAHVYKKTRLREDLYVCINYIRSAIKKYPNDPELFHMLGTFFVDINVFDTMVTCYDSVGFYCQSESLDKNTKKKCKKMLNHISKLRQDRWEKSYNEAVEFITQYDTITARIANVPSDDADSLKKLDSLKTLAYEMAEADFKDAIMLKPKTSSSYEGYGILLERESKYLEAIDCYHQVLDIQSDDVDIAIEFTLRIGNSYGQLSDWDNSIIWYNKHLEYKPDDVFVLSNLSIVYTNMGNHEKLHETTLKILEVEPENTMALSNASQYYFSKMAMPQIDDSLPDADKRRKELEKESNEYRNKAEGALLKLISIDSTNTESLRKLGVLYLLNQQNDKAVEILERFIEIEPDNVGVLDYLGRAYIQLGEFAKAIVPYENLVEIDPGNVDVWERLAELYDYIKETDKAKNARAKVVELNKI